MNQVQIQDLPNQLSEGQPTNGMKDYATNPRFSTVAEELHTSNRIKLRYHGFGFPRGNYAEAFLLANCW